MRAVGGTRGLIPSRLLASPTQSPTPSVPGASDVPNTMTNTQTSLPESLNHDNQTGQQPVASSSKSAEKVSAVSKQASASISRTPPGSASARRENPSKKGQGPQGIGHSSGHAQYGVSLWRFTSAHMFDARSHRLAPTNRPYRANRHQERDRAGASDMETEETDPAKLAGASPKPDEGQTVNPLEREGPGTFKDGLVNAQKKLLGADMTEGTDRARSAGASSQPDEGKGLDPLEREGEGKFKGGLLNAQHVEVASKAEATRHSPRGAGSLSALVEHPWETNQTAVVEPLGASNDVATAVSGQLDAPLTAQDKGDAMDVDFDVAALCALFEKLSLHDQTAVAEPLVVGNDVTTAVSGELHAPPTEQGEEGGPMDVDWEGSSHSSLSSADEDDDEDDADRMEVDDEDVPMTDMTPESQPNHTVSCYGPCNGITLFQAYC
ncbi:hypothetical protein JB92DRAFT_3103479 [Gautieria morchelliformis]|nr:hypothetical protein JB92DRAFT_3103479 [Gautieria morchelliformis]